MSRTSLERGFSLVTALFLLVVLALEELQSIGKQRALVASIGWNQQAAAVWIERTPG